MVPPTTEMLIGEALLRADEMEQLVTKLDEETKENIANLERRNDAKMQKLEQSVEALLGARVVQLEAQNAHLQRQMQLMAEQMEQVQHLVLPKQAGLSCSEARRAGMNVRQASCSGYELREIWEAGFTCAEAKQAGYIEGLKQAGYTCAEAKQAGFSPQDCRDAGFSYEEGCAAGYRFAQYYWHHSHQPW